MRHIPEPAEPSEPLPIGEAEAEFTVGGVKRTLSPADQLNQLVSYMDATYPRPDVTAPWRGGAGDRAEADLYLAHLPDRITHAAMLMLGSALDHTMPGVAYSDGITVEELPDLAATLFTPSEPTGRWAISLHPGGWWRGAGIARQMRWQPEVAAAAQLSGTTIVDLDYPLAPEHTVADMVAHVRRALDVVRSHNPQSVTIWGASSGGTLATLLSNDVDALVLTYPSLNEFGRLPDDIRAGAEIPPAESWPRTLVQIALYDDRVARPDLPASVRVVDYHSTHTIATPEESRRRIRDVADFLST
ncbi:alpha/beta hydrolase fold domain-containing protein [Corynebacterium aquatimens]|nr:alpha/beta hydrolase [Corynebacterium aquatimens]